MNNAQLGKLVKALQEENKRFKQAFCEIRNHIRDPEFRTLCDEFAKELQPEDTEGKGGDREED